MRRDVAGLALSCAARVIRDLSRNEKKDAPSQLMLAVSFIRIIEAGLGQISVEDDNVYIRAIPGLERHALH